MMSRPASKPRAVRRAHTFEGVRPCFSLGVMNPWVSHLAECRFWKLPSDTNCCRHIRCIFGANMGYCIVWEVVVYFTARHCVVERLLNTPIYMYIQASVFVSRTLGSFTIKYVVGQFFKVILAVVLFGLDVHHSAVFLYSNRLVGWPCEHSCMEPFLRLNHLYCSRFKFRVCNN